MATLPQGAEMPKDYRCLTFLEPEMRDQLGQQLPQCVWPNREMKYGPV